MEELLGSEDEILIIILIAVGLLVLMSVAIVLFFYFSRKKIIKTELEKANLKMERRAGTKPVIWRTRCAKFLSFER